jgi:hypothetical protein
MLCARKGAPAGEQLLPMQKKVEKQKLKTRKSGTNQSKS